MTLLDSFSALPDPTKVATGWDPVPREKMPGRNRVSVKSACFDWVDYLKWRQ